MRKVLGLWLIPLVAVLFALTTSGMAETGFVQPQVIFEKAIRSGSTHSYVVFATYVNDHTGEARTECMPAKLFISAIHREHGLGGSPASHEEAIQIALRSPDRIFHFSKQSAIDNIPAFHDSLPYRNSRDAYEVACRLVKQGKSVFFADITAQVMVDP